MTKPFDSDRYSKYDPLPRCEVDIILSRLKDACMTPEEAAKALDVTKEGVFKLCRSGRLEAKHIGRLWVIMKESVLAYREERDLRGRRGMRRKGAEE